MSKLIVHDDETAHEILSAAIVPSICNRKILLLRDEETAISKLIRQVQKRSSAELMS